MSSWCVTMAVRTELSKANLPSFFMSLAFQVGSLLTARLTWGYSWLLLGRAGHRNSNVHEWEFCKADNQSAVE
jgi:hypothetical protein